MDKQKTKIKVPLILQREACECGAASLSMIMGYYGRFEKLIDVRTECNVTKDGCSVLDLSNAAEKYGMEAEAYMCPSTLVSAKFPCIGFWNRMHFVVIEGMDEKTVFIADPAVGHVQYTREEFAKHFSGIIVNIAPTDAFEKQGKPFNNIAYIRNLFVKKERIILFVGVISLISYLVGITITKLEEGYMDYLAQSLNLNGMEGFFIAFVAMLIIQLAVLAFQLHMQIRLERMESASVTQNVYKKLFSLPFDYFQKRSHSTLESKLTNINSLTDFLSSKFISSLFNTIFSIIYLVMLFTYSPLMAVMVIIIIAVIILTLSSRLENYRNQAVSKQNEMSKFYSTVVQDIQLFDTIKATAGEEDAMRNAMDDYYIYENEHQKSKKTMSFIQTIPMVAPLFLQIMVLIIGIYLCRIGMMTMGAVIASQSLAVLLYSAINTFVNSWNSFQNQLNTVSVMDDIDEEPIDELSVRVNTEKEDGFTGRVEVRNISFGYNRAKPPIIDNVSLSVKPGETMAIVGASGSGKSTILQLIEGLYLPWKGEILFDGVAFKDTNKSQLADAVSVVSQKAVVVCGTVNDNITLFNNQISTSAIVQAAKDACIYDDIMAKQNGFKEIIDPLSPQFSGGQVQRIMIARALVKDPKILILDEATSALDTIVEEQVMKNIKKRNITIFIVAHRLSTIRDCSRIVVLDKGKIAEQGTHEELLQIKDGYYTKLVASGENNIYG